MFTRSDLADLRAELIAAGASKKDAESGAKDIGHAVWCFGSGGRFWGERCDPFPTAKELGQFAKAARERKLKIIKAAESLETALDGFMPFCRNVSVRREWPRLLEEKAKNEGAN